LTCLVHYLDFGCGCFRASRLRAAGIEPIQIGVIGRPTELVLIAYCRGRIRITSLHELPLGEV